MTKAFHEVHNIYQAEKPKDDDPVHPLTMRQASYMLAVKRVAKAITMRGIYP
jgi:glutamate dehydrogenase/leucine dehydrogenase